MEQSTQDLIEQSKELRRQNEELLNELHHVKSLLQKEREEKMRGWSEAEARATIEALKAELAARDKESFLNGDRKRKINYADIPSPKRKLRAHSQRNLEEEDETENRKINDSDYLPSPDKSKKTEKSKKSSRKK